MTMTSARRHPDPKTIVEQVRAGILDHSYDDIPIWEHDAAVALEQRGGMDAFALRDRVVGEYRDYVESFVRILDPRIDGFVRGQLQKGELWPDAVLQLNPAFEQGDTLAELARRGVIRQETAAFFGPDIRLHRHQQQALEIAQHGEPYVVSTGTGSGKSLTYLVPIYDAILQAERARHTVRAIIVYPMNALINS